MERENQRRSKSSTPSAACSTHAMLTTTHRRDIGSPSQTFKPSPGTFDYVQTLDDRGFLGRIVVVVLQNKARRKEGRSRSGTRRDGRRRTRHEFADTTEGQRRSCSVSTTTGLDRTEDYSAG